MSSKAIQDVTAIINENTERRSLEELAAQGKRHFRVVSGSKVLRLIEALVDDAVRHEAGELARRDRDRIVKETRSRFDRVMKLQAEQDAEIRAQRSRADEAERQAAEARDAALRARQAAEMAIGRFVESEKERVRLEAEVGAREASLARVREDAEARLETLRATALERAGRLEAELERRRRGAVRAAMRARRLARVVRRLMARTAGDETAVRIGREIDDMKGLLRGVADRPAGTDEGTVNSLLARLSEREDRIEGRFTFQMDRTLEEINRALHVATMRPVDVSVEATDVLVDRIFDQDGEMRTNLDVLAVEEVTSGNGISGHLARLREARGTAANAGEA